MDLSLSLFLLSVFISRDECISVRVHKMYQQIDIIKLQALLIVDTRRDKQRT